MFDINSTINVCVYADADLRTTTYNWPYDVKLNYNASLLTKYHFVLIVNNIPTIWSAGLILTQRMLSAGTWMSAMM